MQKFAYADADKILFTADTHFGHAAIIGMCDRPFANVDEMDQEMIERWNAAVRPSDTVWHLGDFAHKARPDRVNWIFSRLNGVKHLVAGNHDKRPALGLGWDSVHDIVELDVAGQRLVLCHYAMRTWPGAGPRVKAIHLYGHSHGNMPGSRHSLDVGVDNVGYTPLRLEHVRMEMAKLPDVVWQRGNERPEEYKKSDVKPL